MPSAVDVVFGDNWRGRRPTFDDERKLAYLRNLADSGTKAWSAAMVGQYPQAIDDERKRCPAFDRACELALQLHVDQVDRSIYERGILGIDAAEFHKGEWFTSEKVKKYSDALAALYAKRTNPAYRDRVQVEGLENSGVLIVPATIADPQEWAKQFERSTIDDEEASDPPHVP